jgi:hypothetical protein
MTAVEFFSPEEKFVPLQLENVLQGSKPVTEERVSQAAKILQKVADSPHPAEVVASSLQEIDESIPGLLALNIRQARLDGRPDLAQTLESLLENINFQLHPAGGPDSSAFSAPDGPHPFPRRLLFLSPRGSDLPQRLLLPAGAVAQYGCQAEVADELPLKSLRDFDLVIAHRPFCDPKLMEGLAACAAEGIPILLDLEIDLENMPVTHPDYEVCGLKTLARARAYTAALLLATKISVPSQAHAANLIAAGFPVVVMPDGWSQQNPLWNKPASPRHRINLGWLGAPGDTQDVTLIRRIVIRVLREFPQTELVICRDPQVYQMFDSLPEERRLFLPEVSDEDHPHLVRQLDLLLVPLRNTPFNRTVSDRWLMEAGIRQIPWLASPMPAFLDWEAGGHIAENLDDWHIQLRKFIVDENLRVTLGLAGRRLAERREMDFLVRDWLSVFRSMLSPTP